jgi:hypothetical protein
MLKPMVFSIQLYLLPRYILDPTHSLHIFNPTLSSPKLPWRALRDKNSKKALGWTFYG